MLTVLKSPLVRISFGLVLLTLSILMLTEFLGLIPDTKRIELKSRKVITESLAVQLSSAISKDDMQSVKETLRSVVERNDQILSGAVRLLSNESVASYGDHANHWTLKDGNKSTPTQVQVPLFNDQGRWGTIELRFIDLWVGNNLLPFKNSLLQLLLFMSIAGFLTYLLFLKRAMRELNPDEVIPERVRKALDTFAEGLLILDRKGHIVFSNTAFADKLGFHASDLVGKDCAGLGWQEESADSGCAGLPWQCVLDGEAASHGSRIELRTALDEVLTFDVNASPIISSSGDIQGVMITFDDITDIETKNEELSRTLAKLEHSQEEITRQNRELQVLATRDPLSGVLNRRSFFQGFETLFNEARDSREALCCMMVDIDHFKSVNDRYGHAVGDQVIKWLAQTLTEHSRPDDLVGRYGGEEFCVVLPGVNLETGEKIAERIRQAVQQGRSAEFPEGLNITSSFGVSDINRGATTHGDLIEQADWALYTSKESGRNQVTCWSDGVGDSKTSKEMAGEKDLRTNHAKPVANLVSAKKQSDQVRLEEKSNSAEDTNDRLYQFFMRDGNPSPAVSEQSEQKPAGIRHETSCLPDRILLFDRINQAIKNARRQDSHVAVMVLDLDVLQRVSDAMGLAVGEKLARIIISRLKKILRDTDTVTLTKKEELLFSISRLGAHQIVILLTDMKTVDVVTGILQRILSSQDDPVEVEGNEYYIDANVGISMYPVDGQDSDTLLRHAGSAMREAMESQIRNSFRFYSDDIDQRFKQRIRLEAELHKALERNELEVYYQPKIDLKTGKILGMEALLRWQHPQLRIVPPSEFIPLAEQTGLIEDIGLWVVRAVCKQIRLWLETGHGIVTVAVNMSPMQFRNPNLAKQIISILQECDVPASALEIEITEGVIMQDIEAAIDTLKQLDAAGLSISLDDFGTGYSSLGYLKRFPISKIKIDRSFISDFVNDPNEAAIVSAIIAMSHSLGLRVVAEGVETKEQLQFLQDLYCDEMQGYLVSKPLPKDQAKAFLSQPSKIKRLVQGVQQHPQLASQSGISPAPGMIGLLNDCPVSVQKQ